MDVGTTGQSCTRFGLWWGIRLACIYAGILSIVWAVSSAPLTVGFSERVFGFLWFWLYGCIVGSIIGGTGGAASGYILCKVLMRLKLHIRGHAWVVGLAVHIVTWFIVHVTIGRLLFLEPGSQPLYQVFIGYPGIIYIAAGGVLAQYWYVKHIK